MKIQEWVDKYPGDPEALRDALVVEIERQQMALEAIAGFGSVNLAGEYEHGLRDIIRSMTDCARDALTSAEPASETDRRATTTRNETPSGGSGETAA